LGSIIRNQEAVRVIAGRADAPFMLERRAVKKRIDGVVVPSSEAVLSESTLVIFAEWLWRRTPGWLDKKESVLSREAEATRPKPGLQFPNG
jgi:hypothetical protein